MTTSETPRVLFVHPATPMFLRCILPLSLPALVKRIPAPVRGYYAHELPVEAVRTAKLIVADVHWYLSLRGAASLVRKIRAVNPDVPIVAGGLTASLYPHLVIDRLGFDYVIRGDAEIPLARLAEALLGGGDPSGVPNLAGRNGFETPWTYALTKADLDANDFLDTEFFPTYQKDVARVHAANRHWPMAVHPSLTAFRGCPKECAVCAGSPREQAKLFRRGPVVRDAERVADDLERIGRDPDMRFLTVHTDFLNLLPESYGQEALRRPTHLGVQYDFMAAPTMGSLDLLLASFAGGLVRFSADEMHLTTSVPADPETLVRLIRRVKAAQGFIPILQYNGTFAHTHPEYRRAVAHVARATGCPIRDESHWWSDFPRPDDSGDAAPESFDRFLNPPADGRFPVMNLLERAGVAVNLCIPTSWASAYRLAYYHLFQNAPFLLRSYLADRGN